MKVLIACEESQRITIEFRKLGHEAYSCDIQDPSGGHPEWHIKDNVLKIIEGGHFVTLDGIKHYVEQWDLMIAHPPCTYLSNVATRHYSLKCTSAENVIARLREQEKAIVFFLRLMYAPIPRVAVENPVGIMNSIYRKPDQIIHPYYFADSPEDKKNWQTKRTCFWLKNLEPLKYEMPDSKPEPTYFLKTTGKPIMNVEAKHGGKIRSKTFPAVAKAIAEQWGSDSKIIRK